MPANRQVQLYAAGMAAAAFAASARSVDLFAPEPLVNTHRGRNQLTYQDKVKLEMQGHEDRIARAEEKRKRKAAKFKRDLGEN